MSSSDALRPQFVLFGDSISQQSFRLGGWGARLAATYERTADVVNRGFSGYNTRWVLKLLPKVFPDGAAAPALVTVLLGANDAQRPAPVPGHPPDTDGRQHVPLNEYGDNLAEIVAWIRRCGSGGARVLLITPPPVDDEVWAADCIKSKGLPANAEPNRTKAMAAEYARVCAEVGERTQTPVLDLHAAMAAQAGWREMFVDGLHPNAAGGAFIHEQVVRAIELHFPKLRPAAWGEDAAALERLPYDFPSFHGIDGTSAATLERTFARYEAQREAALRACGV